MRWRQYGKRWAKHDCTISCIVTCKHFNTKKSPYLTTLDLNAFLKDRASDTESAFIKSVIEEITLYDFKLSQVESNKLDDGNYEITLTINAAKVAADGQGFETLLGLSELVDIALFAIYPEQINATDKLPYLQKHLIQRRKNYQNDRANLAEICWHRPFC